MADPANDKARPDSPSPPIRVKNAVLWVQDDEGLIRLSEFERLEAAGIKWPEAWGPSPDIVP